MMQDNYFSNAAASSLADDLMYMPVIGLGIGMKVVALDKPWGESTFALQGLVIETTDDIDALRAECHHVYIEKEEDLFGMSIVRGKAIPPVFDWTDPPGGRII